MRTRIAHRRRATPVVVAVIAAAALAGCGVSDPYNSGKKAEGATTAVAQPAPSSAAPTATGAQTREAALRTFAVTWANWSSKTQLDQLRALLALAVPPLANELAADYGQVGRDAFRAASNASSAGRYIGAMPQPDGSFVVVTHERADAGNGGGGQVAYGVYVARLKQVDGAWKISRWVPSA